MARNFIDKLGAELDEEAVGFTTELKETKIPGKLPKENISVYEIKWEAEHGVNPDSSAEHRLYIDKLCDDFLRTLKQMIDNGVKDRFVLFLFFFSCITFFYVLRFSQLYSC